MTTLLSTLLIIGGTAFLSWPLGKYLAAVMEPKPGLRGLPGRVDGLIRQFCGGNGASRQTWKDYLLSMLVFNALMFGACAAMLALQHLLPLNPDARGPLSWDLIFNTAASFATNTNLQHYSGEVHMSYFSQIMALMWLQFVSAATGLACLTALARGLCGKTDFGDFYVDLVRATFLVLLPLALFLSAAYVLGGVPMTFGGSIRAMTLEGEPQLIARGPVAAFLAIKQLGTNGGGFFGPNSTHPFENPTFFTSGVSMVAILLLPMACVWMFGRLTHCLRHATVVFAVMLCLLLIKACWAFHYEGGPTPAFVGLPIEQSGGNLEGKELRFGAATGPLWSVLTTATSNGSVGAMHDSLNALTGLAPMAGMWLNETFGGVGVGFINMFVYVLVAVFLAGMMIGRTPEYMGRRVEAAEMIWIALVLLLHPVLILCGTALFSVTEWGTSALNNSGPHGFSEILYEFSSAAANNGSGFEGLADNTVGWNVATGLVMLLGRYVPIILPLAVAGLLAAKRPAARTAGTLPTGSPTFGVMLFCVIVLFGALTFLPVALLGPVADHLTTR